MFRNEAVAKIIVLLMVLGNTPMTFSDIDNSSCFGVRCFVDILKIPHTSVRLHVFSYHCGLVIFSFRFLKKSTEQESNGGLTVDHNTTLMLIHF